jgi:hypothetical protein
VHLTGWARPVFAGSLSEQFAKELEETDDPMTDPLDASKEPNEAE